MTISSRLAALHDRMGRERSILLASLILSLAATAPLLTTEILPLGDLVFHMARMKVLASLDAPYFRDWFQASWAFIPNLALDLAVPPLAALIGVAAATKVFVAATLVLMLTGALALHHSLYRKLSWFPLCTCLFLYNFVLFWGFVNYLFGIGLLLWALACWFWCKKSVLALRVLVGAVFAFALYTAHLCALGLFGVIVVASELSDLIDCKTLRKKEFIWALAASTLPFILPFIALLKSSLAVTAVGSPGYGIHYGLTWKALAWPTLLVTRNPPVDFTMTAGVAAIALLLLFRRAIGIARPVQLPILAMIAVIVLLPSTIAGTGFVAERFPVAAVFIVISACRIRSPLSPPLRAGLAMGVAFLFTLRIVATFVDFSVAGRETADITAQFAKLTPGAVLFEASVEPKPLLWPWQSRDNWQPLWRRQNQIQLGQLTTTALLYQPVLVPELLLIDGQQPARFVPPFRELKSLQDSSGDNPRWLADQAALVSWLDEIRAKLKTFPHRFPAVYVTLLGPTDLYAPPDGVVQLFSDHRYRIWDVSAFAR